MYNVPLLLTMYRSVIYRPGMPGFEVADNIRAELARRRVSQAELAVLLGLTRQSISRRLNGEVPFRDGEVNRIADHLSVDVATLFRMSA